MKNKLSSIILSTFITLLSVSTIGYSASASSEYSKALHNISEKRYKQAISILNELETNEKMLEKKHFIYYQLSICYFNLKDSKTAIDYAEKSIEAKRSFVKPYIILFELYNSANRFEDATYILHDLVERNPGQYEYYFTLGIMYGKYIKNDSLSRYCFEKVISISKKQTVPSQYLENSYLYLSNLYFTENRNREALQALDYAAKYNPTHNSRFYNAANYYISKNMLNEAVYSVRLFVDNLTEDQKSEEYIYKIYAFLGRMYYLQDRKEAMYYLRLGSLDSSYESEICRALFNELAGKHVLAEKELQAIIAKNPNYISPYYALAKIMQKKGKKAEAYDYFVTTSLMLYNSGLTLSAKNSLLQSLSIKPEVPKSHELLAQLYEGEKKYSAALYHYKKSDPKMIDLEKIIHIAYLYYFEENYNEATKVINMGYKIDKNNPRLYFTHGIILAAQKRHQQALEKYEKAILLDDKNDNFYFYLAISQDNDTRFDEAVVSLKKALVINKTNSEYLNYLGYLYANKNTNLNESRDLLDSALKLKPFNGAYLDSMGWLLYKKGDYQSAKKYLIRAYRNLEAEGRSDSEVYDHLGDTYLKLGKANYARYYWKRALKLEKNSSSIKEKLSSMDKK